MFVCKGSHSLVFHIKTQNFYLKKINFVKKKVIKINLKNYCDVNGGAQKFNTKIKFFFFLNIKISNFANLPRDIVDVMMKLKVEIFSKFPPPSSRGKKVGTGRKGIREGGWGRNYKG